METELFSELEMSGGFIYLAKINGYTSGAPKLLPPIALYGDRLRHTPSTWEHSGTFTSTQIFTAEKWDTWTEQQQENCIKPVYTDS